MLHKCTFLDGVFCRGDEHCQYKMTTACYPLGEKYCGIEVMRSHVKGGMCEECRSRPYKSDAVLGVGVDYILQKLEQEYDDGGYDPDIPLWIQVRDDLKKLRQKEREQDGWK